MVSLWRYSIAVISRINTWILPTARENAIKDIK
jgi:hypothetical protein